MPIKQLIQPTDFYWLRLKCNVYLSRCGIGKSARLPDVIKACHVSIHGEVLTRNATRTNSWNVINPLTANSSWFSILKLVVEIYQSSCASIYFIQIHHPFLFLCHKHTRKWFTFLQNILVKQDVKNGSWLPVICFVMFSIFPHFHHSFFISTPEHLCWLTRLLGLKPPPALSQPLSVLPGQIYWLWWVGWTSGSY